MDNGLALCGTEFEPVETVVCSEESIRDSLDFQEEEYCEEQIDDQADVSDDRNMAAADAAQPDSPSKSNGVSDASVGSAQNGFRELHHMLVVNKSAGMCDQTDVSDLPVIWLVCRIGQWSSGRNCTSGVLEHVYRAESETVFGPGAGSV